MTDTDSGVEDAVSLGAERDRWRLWHEDLSARIKTLEAERIHLRARIADLEARVLDASVNPATAPAPAPDAGREDLARRLSHALETIANMQRSRFWKARLLWLQARQLVRPQA